MKQAIGKIEIALGGNILKEEKNNMTICKHKMKFDQKLKSRKINLNEFGF